MDYIHESKIFNERASVSERVSWIFLTSEYNPYKRGTRVIIYLLYTPYYLYFLGAKLQKNLGSGSEFHTHFNLILMSALKTIQVGAKKRGGGTWIHDSFFRYLHTAIWLVEMTFTREHIFQYVHHQAIWLVDEKNDPIRLTNLYLSRENIGNIFTAQLRYKTVRI